jgi:hypothetical protein
MMMMMKHTSILTLFTEIGHGQPVLLYIYIYLYLSIDKWGHGKSSVPLKLHAPLRIQIHDAPSHAVRYNMSSAENSRQPVRFLKQPDPS